MKVKGGRYDHRSNTVTTPRIEGGQVSWSKGLGISTWQLYKVLWRLRWQLFRAWIAKWFRR